MGFVDTTEVLSKIPAGVIHGATAVNLIGVNAAPTTTFETLWDNSNAYTFLTTNMTTPTIVSSSANDAAAGTGARTVRITGINASFAAQTEDIILNGVTPVSLVNSYMTINSITVLTAGSGGTTAGNLTLAAGGVTHGYVLAGRNQSTSFIYSTPAEYGLLIYNFYCSEEAASAGGNRAQIVYSTNGGVSKVAFSMGTPTNFPLDITFTIPIYIPAKSQVQGQFLSAASTSTVTAFSSCVLLDRRIGDNTTNVASTVSKWI